MNRKSIRAFVLLLLSALMLFQPVAPALADDCSALQQRVNDLRRDADDLQRELNAAERELASDQKDMLKQRQLLKDTQAKINELPDKPREQISDKLDEELLTGLKTALAAAMLVALEEPVVLPHESRS